MATDRTWAAWLEAELEDLTDTFERVSPSTYNEGVRYLPESVTALPGPMRFSVVPHMKEIVDCFDLASPVREVSVMKGVQVGYTTLLECGILYFAGHVKTIPVMLVTADKDLVRARLENNILPMFHHSGLSSIIQSSDVTNKRKTGQTASLIQWEGGGFLIPFGARNADKMRSFSILAMLKDEIDAWLATVGKDGDPDLLTDDRCSAYWEVRKIFRGSTPLIKGSSKIYRAYLRGDQRRYFVRCLKCGFAQYLGWGGENDRGEKFGMAWDMNEDGHLDLESVRYLCRDCGHPHQEHDKLRLFAPEHGAEWRPTATAEEGIRSYHIPALLSPVGFQPWSKCVAEYLQAYDPDTKTVKDFAALQTFFNNILAKPFEVFGGKVSFATVSSHRRSVYRMGEIPHAFAKCYCTSPILLLTCAVDVHKNNLAVAVFGWTQGTRCFLLDYWRFEDSDCTLPESPAWGRLQEVIEERDYEGQRVACTVIDAGFAQDTVTTFCEQYAGGVVPILGRANPPSGGQRIREFETFTTQSGQLGFLIRVDHYKDRIAPALRRDWNEQLREEQRPYHFNAPVDLADKALKELTAEVKKERRDPRGFTTYEWYRPSNVPNELWDLLVYGHATVDLMAWDFCVQTHELQGIDWRFFWSSLESENKGEQK